MLTIPRIVVTTLWCAFGIAALVRSSFQKDEARRERWTIIALLGFLLMQGVQ